MHSTGLFLAKDEVRPGMVVALAVEGGIGLILSEDTHQPYILRAFKDEMYSGGIKLLDANLDGTLITGQDGSFSGFTRIADASPEARFMPIQVFDPNNAPPYTECVAILHGRVLPSLPKEKGPDARIVTLGDGIYLSAEAFEHGEHESYSLPSGVILVPVSGIGAKLPCEEVVATP